MVCHPLVQDISKQINACPNLYLIEKEIKRSSTITSLIKGLYLELPTLSFRYVLYYSLAKASTILGGILYLRKGPRHMLAFL